MGKWLQTHSVFGSCPARQGHLTGRGENLTWCPLADLCRRKQGERLEILVSETCHHVLSLLLAVFLCLRSGHAMPEQPLRGNKWAVKRGLLEDDSSRSGLFGHPRVRVYIVFEASVKNTHTHTCFFFEEGWVLSESVG